MTAVTFRSDFGAQKNKICHCFHFSTMLLIGYTAIFKRGIIMFLASRLNDLVKDQRWRCKEEMGRLQSHACEQRREDSIRARGERLAWHACPYSSFSLSGEKGEVPAVWRSSTKKRTSFMAIQVPVAPPNASASTADEDRFSVYSNEISLHSLSLQQAPTLWGTGFRSWNFF